MKKFNKKYRNRFGILFLSIYFTFILLGTLHYHVYDIGNENSYLTGSDSYPYTDLTSDFFSVCSMHQFSQSINDIHYSSSGIIQSLKVLESNLDQVKLNNSLIVEYSKTSPRAPPFFIS